jgi:hypothetical protein
MSSAALEVSGLVQPTLRSWPNTPVMEKRVA